MVLRFPVVPSTAQISCTLPTVEHEDWQLQGAFPEYSGALGPLLSFTLTALGSCTMGLVLHALVLMSVSLPHTSRKCPELWGPQQILPWSLTQG